MSEAISYSALMYALAALNSTGEGGGETPPSGKSISKIGFVKSEGLIDTYRIYYTDGTTWDYNVTNGSQGEAGFSPIVTEKVNTDTEYILTITNENGSFDTSNLKGEFPQDGLVIDGGEIGQ